MVAACENGRGRQFWRCVFTTVRTCLIETDVVCFEPDKYLKMAQNLFPRATPTAPSIPVGPAGPLAGPVRTSGHA